MKKMKTLVYKDLGKIVLEERPVPNVTEPFEVVIKVSACGICGTDVKIMEGKHVVGDNVAIGHEFCGIVEEIGSHVTSLKTGDRVAVDNSLRCGLCEPCRTGNSPQCDWLKTKSIGIFQNGGYAEYCLLPENACFKIPDSIDDITATQVETLGTVLNGMNTVQMQCWDTVVILGFGPIGYLFAALAKDVAAKVLVTEIDAFRFNVAKQLGVPVLNPNEVDLEKEILSFTDGKGADVVIDACGSQLENAIKYVAPGGKILAFGMDSSIKASVVPNTITRKAIKILGTYIGQNTIVPAIKILESGKINMKPFFTDVIPLENGVSAFNKLGLDLASLKHIPKQAMKIVIKP
ncbi:MAG: alcohol dehydrogenase catalytic domain-containing protein [Melioribacteraceae bacterium]